MPTAHRPWRRNGVFGPGPRVPLDRERRAQWRAKLLLQRRPGRLTISAAAVGRVLLDMLGQDGRLEPSIDRLATLARVSRATAVRALAQLRQAGFVAWTRRLIRTSATGWRAEQAPNAYVLSVPACESHFAPVVQKQGSSSASASTAPAEKGAARENKQVALAALLLEAGGPEKAQAALARIAVERAARAAQRWLRGRAGGQDAGLAAALNG